jgi:tRNA G10  N-methylase Trm11
MLPPKLAEIMINLSGAGAVDAVSGAKGGGGEKEGNIVVYDPFCGSGTILTEAMLMGIRSLIGSDISAKAVDDTKSNIAWVRDKFNLPETGCRLFKKSAIELSKFIPPQSVDAIVTEPYLGPQRGSVDIGKVKRELEKLYSDALREFGKVLKSDGRVVMVWPMFLIAHNSKIITLDFNLSDFTIVKPEIKIPGITERGTYIYGREGQKVWREIVVLARSE